MELETYTQFQVCTEFGFQRATFLALFTSPKKVYSKVCKIDHG